MWTTPLLFPRRFLRWAPRCACQLVGQFQIFARGHLRLAPHHLPIRTWKTLTMIAIYLAQYCIRANILRGLDKRTIWFIPPASRVNYYDLNPRTVGRAQTPIKTPYNDRKAKETQTLNKLTWQMIPAVLENEKVIYTNATQIHISMSES